MSGINLLPWREWRRERARKALLVNLGLMCAAAIGVVGVHGGHLDHQSQQMDRRNDYLRQRISELDGRIADIEQLTDQTERLLSRLTVAHGLRSNRRSMVRVFDALARTVADGAHYTALSMTGDLFAARGAAASNDRVSSLMRNIEDSRWFTEPSLKSISETRDGPHYGGRASEFELTFRRTEAASERHRAPRPEAGAGSDRQSAERGDRRHA